MPSAPRREQFPCKFAIALAIMLAQSFAQDFKSAQAVQIGKWSITEHRQGRFCAKADGDLFLYLDIEVEDELEQKLPEGSVQLEVSGVGKVFAFILASPSTVQSRDAMFDVDLQKEFWHQRGESWITLTSVTRVRPSRNLVDEYQDLEDGNLRKKAYELAEAAKKNALNDIIDEPALELLQEMQKEEVELARFGHATDLPKIEASLDRGEFIELALFDLRGGARNNWALPATAGQDAMFRFTYPCARVVVTTFGKKVTADSRALQGEKVGLRTYVDTSGGVKPPPFKESTIDEHGVAVLDFGVLESQQRIDIQRGPLQPGKVYDRIYLRTGKSDERQLNNKYFKPARPTSDNAEAVIQALLIDIESSFDSDVGQFLTERRSHYTYVPSASDKYALQGLALKEYPNLSTLKYDATLKDWLWQVFRGAIYPENEFTIKSRDAESLALLIFDCLRKPGSSAALWQSLSGASGNPSEWHHPEMVYGLSALWNRFPNLRPRNDLERVLDYWVKAIALRSAPVEGIGKGGIVIDKKIMSYGFAAAALQNGYNAFGKPEYLNSRDAVLRAMRQLANDSSSHAYYDDMITYSVTKQMFEFVTLYGQTCTFIGDQSERARAQTWIRTTLSKPETPHGDEATFQQRCGMISVLRGRASYLEVPELRNTK